MLTNMYKSPIEIIYDDIKHSFEEGIYKAIQKVDIKVNRDELLKALAYDRQQYEKGYADALAERKKGKWIEREDPIISGTCSCCGWNAVLFETDVAGMPYCPHCGAEMEQK